MCRRASGAPVVTWATVRRDTFELVRGAPRTFASSSHGERGFCPACGSQLTFFSSKLPDELDITVGTLDAPERFPAALHIWTGSRLPWLHLDEHLPDREPE
jgi:hypothetical protein